MAYAALSPMRQGPYYSASQEAQQTHEKVASADKIERLDPAEFANVAYDVHDPRQREYVAEVLERFVLLVSERTRPNHKL
jgi:hypothetical protein